MNIFSVKLFVCFFLVSSIVHAQPQTTPPNIIVILVDDQGWTDLSSKTDSKVSLSASDYYETPNIDILASLSKRFTNGYSPAPICTPSRASILTGKSPQKLGFTDIIESRPGGRRFTDLYAGKKLISPQPVEGLPEAETTIAEMIGETVPIDYAKAHFGKWHIGGGGPGLHGFEAHDGATGNHSYNAHSHDPNPKDVFGITGRAIAFINSQVNSQRPFFLQLSHYANHVPLSATESSIQKYRAKKSGLRHTNPIYAAINEDLDESVGKLMRALDKMGIIDNTYIFYLSDNGGSMNIKRPNTNNAPLKKGKTWLYEGGIRVPFMVFGPDIKPGEIDVPVIGWDLFPTICSLVGCEGPMPEGLEGGDLSPILLGNAKHVTRAHGDILVWHFPHYITIKGSTPQSAIRHGDWKLVKFYHHDKSYLFNLNQDIGEELDLSEEYPNKKNELEQKLSDYLTSVNAAMPVINEGIAP